VSLGLQITNAGGAWLPPFFYTGPVIKKPARCIFLVGPMGVGKSTIGPLLAKRLGWSFLDSDHEIEARAGQTIPEIFAEQGEASFREIEAETIASISSAETVIALGGGALTHPGATERLQERGMIVYLHASADVLVGRIGNPASRPLLADLDPEGRREKLRALLEERRPLYERASIQVDASGSAEETVDRILAAMKLADNTIDPHNETA